MKYVNGIENYVPAVAVSDLISSSSSVVVGVGGSHRHLRFRKKLSICETMVVCIAKGPNHTRFGENFHGDFISNKWARLLQLYYRNTCQLCNEAMTN